MSLMMGACCCGSCPYCSCLPSSITISVSSYTDYASPNTVISWSSFSSVAYKCCFPNTETNDPVGRIMYKLNPIVSGVNTSPISNNYYLVLYVGFAATISQGLCYLDISCVTDAISPIDSTSSHVCLVPRNSYTALTACYGLGEDEYCSPPFVPWTNSADSWFKISNSTNCSICTGLDINYLSTGSIQEQVYSCAIPSTTFTITPSNGTGSFTITIT